MRLQRPRSVSASPAPPAYLSRGVQQRLLTLVGMLLLVLILMNEARQPARWTWLWQLGQTTTSPAAPSVNTSLPDAMSRAMQSKPPMLDPAELEAIGDDSHFRSSEQSAWFGLWRALKHSSEDRLRRDSLGPASYLQIYRQTGSYRGRLVDLQGRLHRAYRVAAPDNAAGIEAYTQCWLTLDEGGREPVVVYALQDVGHEGGELDVPVRLTGVVYKRWSYQSGDGLRVAPVILAKQMDVLKASNAQPTASNALRSRAHEWILILATAILSVVVVSSLYVYTSRRFGVSRRRDLPGQLDVAIEPLDVNANGSRTATSDPADVEGGASR